MDKNDISNHISQRFNQDLEDIRSQVLAMGGKVEKQIDDALRALRDADGAVGERVVRADVDVNAMEVDIDEECTRVLALRQPAASDLRMVIAVIKTITDLERIGDEAEKIARLAMHLSEVKGPAYRHSNGVQTLGRMAAEMVHKALDSFARLDADGAIATAKCDKAIDAEYEALMRQLITYMMEDPRSITSVLDVLWAARSLERIGDHANNICEYVVYLVHGKDVRHISADQIERELQD
ncbi:MAG: phosphate signaling complex protein PhoU [Gammaproteobacteria bacterium]